MVHISSKLSKFATIVIFVSASIINFVLTRFFYTDFNQTNLWLVIAGVAFLSGLVLTIKSKNWRNASLIVLPIFLVCNWVPLSMLIFFLFWSFTGFAS